MTHDELQHSLATHLRAGTDRMVWENTQLGPAASPRPDVFTIDKSFAHFRADAYECKVSVSDLRHDVTSGKWQKYLQFAHRVWFAFPRGMVKLDDVPRECGVILIGDAGTWRSARKPISRSLDNLPRDAWLKLLMEACPSQAVDHRQEPRSSNIWATEEAVRRDLGDEIAQILKDRRYARSSYEAETKRLNEAAAQARRDAKELHERILQQEERARAQLDASILALGETLGMAPDKVNTHSLQRELHDLSWKLRRAGIIGAIETLQKLQAIIRPEREAEHA